MPRTQRRSSGEIRDSIADTAADTTNAANPQSSIVSSAWCTAPRKATSLTADGRRLGPRAVPQRPYPGERRPGHRGQADDDAEVHQPPEAVGCQHDEPGQHDEEGPQRSP